jgi:uncharacterized protein DUF1097
MMPIAVARAANLLVTGGLAGAVAWIGMRFDLLSWVAFIAWVASAIAGAARGSAITALCAMLAGTLSGCLVALFVQLLAQSLGHFALPLVLCVAVGLIALIEEVPRMGQVPIYFLGMIAYFASGLSPGASAVTSIAIPASIGTACGMICPVARGWLEKRAATLLGDR